MTLKLSKEFFFRDAQEVAQDLLGKILIRKINGKEFRARIVETEAYFGEEDPGSRASKGKNKISEMMWEEPGRILVYNVHMHKMFNIVTGIEGKPEAVLIRALEPLNFSLRCQGPGLLTKNLDISKEIHGKNIFNLNELWIEDSNSEEKENFEIIESFRIGLREDLEKPMRFYIKDNKFVSRK